MIDWGEREYRELRHMAYRYRKEGKYKRAIALLEGIVALGVREAYDFQALGALYLQMDRPKAALKYLDFALKLDRQDLPTHLNRTKAYLMKGDVREGMRLARLLTSVENHIGELAEALVMAYEPLLESAERVA